MPTSGMKMMKYTLSQSICWYQLVHVIGSSLMCGVVEGAFSAAFLLLALLPDFVAVEGMVLFGDVENSTCSSTMGEERESGKSGEQSSKGGFMVGKRGNNQNRTMYISFYPFQKSKKKKKETATIDLDQSQKINRIQLYVKGVGC